MITDSLENIGGVRTMPKYLVKMCYILDIPDEEL